MTTPTCHPERPHCAHGLCRPCYRKAHKEMPGIREAKAKYWRAYRRTPKRSAWMKAYRARPEILDRQARAQLQRNWKKMGLAMTFEKYDGLLRSQGGGCALCGRRPPPRLHVDHDHRTGRIRGLLCSHCNHIVIGRLEKVGLERVLSYLR